MPLEYLTYHDCLWIRSEHDENSFYVLHHNTFECVYICMYVCIYVCMYICRYMYVFIYDIIFCYADSTCRWLQSPRLIWLDTSVSIQHVGYSVDDIIFVEEC